MLGPLALLILVRRAHPLAGALLLTPAFLTVASGVLLLLTPTRAAVRGSAVRAPHRRAGLGPFRPF